MVITGLPARPLRKGYPQWAILFLCLLLCRLLPLGDLAARRADAAVLPCALGTLPSLADGSPSRAHALLAWHEEAALGCALVAGYHDLYPTSIPPFLLPQYVATRTYTMPPNEVLRIFREALFTWEVFEDFILAHDDEEIKRR
jgi:hypothetical protein